MKTKNFFQYKLKNHLIGKSIVRVLLCTVHGGYLENKDLQDPLRPLNKIMTLNFID